ncbi:E3 ubiquitin-protein ligase HERC4 [Phytophthora cinnamomi]|uniref:E3 ubiquitin-protein ligase HERC4 n=1 Tax=Phytophthora cinnamomi TaxID=4785 RepID=UPI00355A7EAB|nr:E3 ubiquitin-protein ligase HERC4 [Phytophthora cinnamomi]
MADRLIHQRVFKVSKELNRLDLLCEQHRRQIGHRDGLPDWEQPRTRAGKTSARHQTTPAFFAWNEEPQQRSQATWQTQTPQKVARTLDMTPTREREALEDAEPAPERSPFDNSSEDGRESAAVLPLPPGDVEDEGMDEDSAIEVDSEARSEEEEQAVDGVRSVATRASNPSLAVDTSSSLYRPSSSPRYKHGRRLLESDAAVTSSRPQGYAAGVTTEQADRYRMNRSSGKRFRSPAKPTALWDDLCNSYIHQSTASSNSRNEHSFSHKRLARSAAERAFGGSSVFRTLNMDTYAWPRSGGEHRLVSTGSEAMNVANQAMREFLGGGRDEETKQSEPPVQPQQRGVVNSRVVVAAAETAEDVGSSSRSSNRKDKRGSEIRYRLKLTRPPSKGKAVTIHVRVIMNKVGITASPTQLIVTSKDWRQTREITVTSSVESELRTFQIHHKIHETYDEVYNAMALLPSLFVSVLQKEATFLFGFGCGIDGRLGTYGDTNTTTPTPFTSRWLHPLQLACGKAHSAVVDVYSNLYCFGLGENGQLGQGEDNLDSSQEPVRVPQLTSTCVQFVACGANHTLCMSVDGRVYAWGDNTFGQLGMGTKSAQPVGTPFRVEKLVSVRGIACGGGQSFIMTRTNVLASGSNIAGQLGMGDRIDRTSFEHIPFFRKVIVTVDALAESSANSWPEVDPTPEDVELSCGVYHTLALSGSRVYSWGIGDDGRLGHGDHESRLVPTLINSLKDTPFTAVACGGSHSGAVTASGDVFTWGSGSQGQLGLGKTRSREQVGRRRKQAQNPAVIQAVADAVQAATADCLRLGSMGFCMESRSPKASARHDQRDEDDEALQITEIAYGLRVESLSAVGGGSDGDYEEDSDDEIALFPVSDRHQAMETDIRTRFSH